jgi:hypothetical protein
MSLADKNAYKTRYDTQVAEHNVKMHNLRRGGPLPGLEGPRAAVPHNHDDDEDEDE